MSMGSEVFRIRGKWRAAPRVCLGFALLIAFETGCQRGPRDHLDFRLQVGDLLFQDLDGSPFYDAIEKVTQGYQGAHLTHVGMVVQDSSGKLAVLDAALEGVQLTSVEEFLGQSRDEDGNPKVLVGRLTPEYQSLIPAAVQMAIALLGKPYDSVFDIENDSYYCSELIHVVFQKANQGIPLFEVRPMTFVDPDTGKTFPAWTDYFNELAIPIPEGQPGLNPGGMSRSPALRIVHAYGRPEGSNSGNLAK